MAFTFSSGSCVTVGTFNIYIFDPRWLKSLGFLKDSGVIEWQTNLSQPGFRFTAKELGAKWIVRPDRLTLESEDAARDCGAMMACVIEDLRRTPFFATGSNFEWAAAIEENDPKRLLDWMPTVSQAHNIVQTGRHVCVEEGPSQFNLAVAMKGEQLIATANVHTDLRGKGPEFAAETARKYFDHRQKAEGLLSDLFGVRFADDCHVDDAR